LINAIVLTPDAPKAPGALYFYEKKTALSTGVTGEVEEYLAELHLAKVF
jgi:hypothetical protein